MTELCVRRGRRAYLMCEDGRVYFEMEVQKNESEMEIDYKTCSTRPTMIHPRPSLIPTPTPPGGGDQGVGRTRGAAFLVCV